MAETENDLLVPPNNASVALAMSERADPLAKPNDVSTSALKSIVEGEPKLASKWAPQDGSPALTLPADTVQFDEDGNVTLLNLGGTRLRTLPAEAFASLTKLQTLNLGATDLPLDQLKAVLQALVAIESLLLGGNSFGPEGTAMVAGIIPTKPTLQHLDLRYDDVRDEGARSLSDALAKNTSIKFLYLEGNNITNVGCEALASALLENSSIEELYLGANDIGPEGAASLAKVITSNTTLNKLYIDGNQIGPQGATAFSEALESMDGKATLRQLYADNNNLGKDAAKRLAKALNSNTAMEDSLFE